MVDLQLEKITDPSMYTDVVHGTYKKHLKSIMNSGLHKMKRCHIHFANGIVRKADHKMISGIRSDCDIHIYINLAACITDGIDFYLSKNGVILTEGNEHGYIETKYFSKIIDCTTGSELSKIIND
ncbi:hypothetical protein GJ496_009696 [Pomphorhynchus laevis]|nr:hypothetical protein GJ496_009696 [Pomphorhynchus laevis]